jgi:VanZ family protein
MKKTKHILISWFLVVFVSCSIFIFSSKLKIENYTKISICYSDKFSHFLLYFILSFLIIRALSFSHRQFPKSSIYFYTISFCSLYGIFIEIYQQFLPERTMSAADAIVNILGSLSCIYLINKTGYLDEKRRRHKERN